MRLIKLLAWMLLGYVVYEMWQGLREGSPTAMAGGGRSGARSSGRGGSGRDESDLERALNEDTGRMMNMTGPGRGTTVTTEDASGTSVPHLVGRGVTPR